jgi:signal peptide peptidase SppA
VYDRIARFVFDTPWAIRPEMLGVIVELLAFRAAGGRLPVEQIAARIGPPRDGPSGAGRVNDGSVAVIPVHGVIAQRAGLLGASSGGTSTEQIAADLRAHIANPEVAAVLLDVDSPGGAVFGVPELAQSLYEARGSKPLVAVANSLAASAAYWLATAVDELVVTPSGEVGSIGVLAAHEDHSRRLDQEGVTVSLINAGTYKGEASPFAPLTAEARAAIQARVDDYYGMFTRDVARHRGVSVATVRNGFGEGRVVGAREAVELGMADRVESLPQTIARLQSARGRAQLGQRAAALVANAGPATEAQLRADAGRHCEEPPWELVSGLDWRRRRQRFRETQAAGYHLAHTRSMRRRVA